MQKDIGNNLKMVKTSSFRISDNCIQKLKKLSLGNDGVMAYMFDCFNEDILIYYIVDRNHKIISWISGEKRIHNRYKQAIEVNRFTRPEYRNNGYQTMLVEELVKDFPKRHIVGQRIGSTLKRIRNKMQNQFNNHQ